MEQNNWTNIDSSDIELSVDFVKDHIAEINITSLLMFYKAELEKGFIRDDYREFVELCVSQFRMIVKDKKALKEVCLFIVTLYVKPWLECTMATKAPNQDLCFLVSLKEYEIVDATISKAAINKTLDDFVSQKSKQVLSRLQIDNSFLQEDVSSWHQNAIFLEAKRRIFLSGDATTLSPFSTNCSAMVAPMPELAPVITATFPTHLSIDRTIMYWMIVTR
ncbi:hypothetical protein NQ318_019525 [Aromia moschata]|uniref:Uncharacterized protein n=1 Tax=Aromia moschata TaxID=1265417 RepID=A0AAV8XZJ8_9CUCU|nr:hypothetical protein NQ318_019525 [Aromia moschata]